MEEKHELTISECIYGVIFNPTKTFPLFRYYKPWGLALVFLLVINIASTLLNVLGGEWLQLMPIRTSIGLFLGVFLFPLLTLFFMFHVSFVHFLAELLGGSGQVLGLFSALAFTQILSLISAVLKFFLSLLDVSGLTFFAPIALILGLWQIILAIIAIREIYLLSTLRAVLIFFLPVILILAITFFMVISGIMFIGPMTKNIPSLNL